MVTTAPAAQPSATHRPVGWDSEVFILRGDNRTHLRERILALAGFVERSKKYRGAPLKVRRFKMDFPANYQSPFDENDR